MTKKVYHVGQKFFLEPDVFPNDVESFLEDNDDTGLIFSSEYVIVKNHEMPNEINLGYIRLEWFYEDNRMTIRSIDDLNEKTLYDTQEEANKAALENYIKGEREFLQKAE